MKKENIEKNYISFLLLGSNKGHRKSNLKRAINKISESEEIEILAKSSLYITKPWGYRKQNNFYNIAIKIKTTYTPQELLLKIIDLEKALGKEKEHFLGPRRIDIDIALFENFIINEKDLVIPHQHLTKRDFFLVPIIEIDNDIVYPQTDKKLQYYLKNLENKYIIKKILI